MSTLRIVAVTLACAMITTGCHTPTVSPSVAALLISANAQCHMQIEQAVSASLKAPIALDQAIFTTDAKLFIEHARPRDADGHLRDGRSLERPRVFRLLQQRQHCLLKDDASAQIFPLNECDCRAK